MTELAHRLALAPLDDYSIHQPPRLEVRAAARRAIVRWQIERHMSDSWRAADLEMPVQPNSCRGEDPRAIWLAPGDWLLVSASRQADDLIRLAAAGSHGRLCQATNVSDSYQVIAVAGDGARELLAKGCGIDFHPRAFPPGRCARTRFAQIAMLIDHGVPDRFELYVDRSHAAWFWSWLVDAASRGSAIAAGCGLADTRLTSRGSSGGL